MTELKYINKEENKNLQIKDLITLGLYTILLILVMAVGIGISTLLTSLIFGGKVYFATYTYYFRLKSKTYLMSTSRY